jgi:hypothetical protein
MGTRMLFGRVAQTSFCDLRFLVSRANELKSLCARCTASMLPATSTSSHPALSSGATLSFQPLPPKIRRYSRRASGPLAFKIVGYVLMPQDESTTITQEAMCSQVSTRRMSAPPGQITGAPFSYDAARNLQML